MRTISLPVDVRRSKTPLLKLPIGTACSGGLGCKEEFSSGYSVFLGARLGSQSERQVFRVFSRLSTMKIMENINSRTRFITVKGNFSALYKRT